jgi:TolB-like protein/Flp pilus assembly protein TadD
MKRRLFAELERRNVIRAALLYIGAIWALAQGVAQLGPAFGMPESGTRWFVIAAAIGFPFWIAFAWYYEFTPQGLKRESELDPAQPATARSRRRFDIAIVAVLALAVVLLLTDRFMSRRAAGGDAAATADKSIAVLPFADMSEKHDQEYFADGLAEELMGMLSKVPALKVPARTSSFYFKGRQETTASIARALGVANLLEGSVRKSGDQLRVSAQLIRAADGIQLWSETYDRRLDDVFKVQEEIAAAVVRSLEPKLLEAGLPKAIATHSQEAYALFLQARSLHYRGTHADNLTGIAYLERALKLDPGFAPAWFGLGDALVYDYVQFGSGTHDEVRRRAGEAAETALRLDPGLADAHLLMGRVLGDLDWNWPEAQREVGRAIQLDPNNMLALWEASVYSLVVDRLDDALRYAEGVKRVDAVSWGSYWAMGDVLWRMNRIAEAEASYRKSTELSPTSSPMHAWLGITLLRQGRTAEALDEMRLETDEGWRRYGLTLALDAAGRHAEADNELATLVRDFADSRAWSIGSLYACRGRLDEAFSWLDKAYRLRDGQLPLIKADPCVGRLDGDPRYRALLKEVGAPG